MDKRNEVFVRGLIIFLGIFCIGFAIYSLYVDIGEVIGDSFVPENIIDVIIGIVNINVLWFLFLFGYVLFLVGTSWRNIFKSVSQMLVSFAVFFIVLFLFFQPIYSNADKISQSVQPSLDLFLVGSIDEILNGQFGEVYNGDINVVVALGEVNNRKLYTKNLSLEDAKLILDIYGLSYFKDEDEILMAKFFISMMYSEIGKSMPEARDVAMSFSQMKETVSSSGLDSDMFKDVDPSLFDSTAIDDEAYIFLSFSNGDNEEFVVNPAKLDLIVIDKLWVGFGFSDNVSMDTKRQIISMFLSQVGNEVDGMNENAYIMPAIPINSITSMIPEEFKILINNDIFSKNMSIRVLALHEVRKYCKSPDVKESVIKMGNETVCSMIEVTEYENLVAKLSDINSLGQDNTEINLPMNLSFLEKVSTVDKLENTIEDYSSRGFWFLIVGLVLFLIAGWVYYLHFTVFDRELIFLHIPYYISKLNLFKFLFTYVIIGVFYYFSRGDFLSDISGSILPQELGVDTTLLFNIPIVEVMFKINTDMFFMSTYYMIFSCIVFGLFYSLLKKKVFN